MFGRKRAQASTRAAHEAAQEKRTAQTEKFRDQRLVREAQDVIAARRSPAEKTRIQANSIAERRKGTPSV